MVALSGQLQLDDVAAIVEQIAALAGALVLLGGIAWRWVLGPKVRELIDLQAQSAGHVRQALVDAPGTLKSDARIAAAAARELPQLRAEVKEVLERVGKLDQERLPERVQLIELETDNHGRRIGSLEQSVIAWLGGQLGVERAERLADHDDRIRAQARADDERERRNTA